MFPHILRIPPYLELQPSLDFAGQVLAVPSGISSVGVDFSAWGRVNGGDLPIKPFGMLIVSQAIRQLRQRLPPHVMIVPMNLPGNDIESYAAHMGFFHACGINLGKPVGAARGGQTYLPLTQHTTAALTHGSQVEPIAKGLARRLAQRQNDDDGLVKALSFSFLEMIRNVIEHSGSPDFWYCAQYWPTRGEAEIAIMDCGIGLGQSLKNNPHVCDLLTSNREILKYALWPGVSGKTFGNRSTLTDDPWRNSGYGLYMNYRICNEGGNFFIASDGAGLYREQNSDNTYYDYALTGVALRLRLRVATLEQFDQTHKARFLEEARREATKIQGGILPTGTSMSQMLRHNFSPEALFKRGVRVTHLRMGGGIIDEIRTSAQGATMLKVTFDNGKQRDLRTDEITLEGV